MLAFPIKLFYLRLNILWDHCFQLKRTANKFTVVNKMSIFSLKKQSKRIQSVQCEYICCDQLPSLFFFYSLSVANEVVGR